MAQRIAPESRIVYVDNDPIVLAHAEALLTSTPESRTDYLDEDLRNVDTVLEHAEADPAHPGSGHPLLRRPGVAAARRRLLQPPAPRDR